MKLTIKQLREALQKRLTAFLEDSDRLRRHADGYGDDFEEDVDRIRRHKDGYGDDFEESATPTDKVDVTKLPPGSKIELKAKQGTMQAEKFSSGNWQYWSPDKEGRYTATGEQMAAWTSVPDAKVTVLNHEKAMPSLSACAEKKKKKALSHAAPSGASDDYPGPPSDAGSE